MIESVSNWAITTDYFGTTKWCREEEVRELEKVLSIAVEALEKIRRFGAIENVHDIAYQTLTAIGGNDG